MLRRVVIAVLILPFLLLQAMSVGHSHGGADPHGHDGTSHFHVGWLWSSCGHDDCHADDEGPGDDHDDDAIYGSPTFGGVPAEKTTLEVASDFCCFYAPPLDSAELDAPRLLHGSTHGPPGCSLSDPIFLRTHSLRI